MRLQVARIGKPHGIRGEVTVQVMTDTPEDRFVPGTELIVEPARSRAAHGRLRPLEQGDPAAGFEEVRDRNTAETLRGAQLFVDAEDVEDDEDAWYEHELEGLDVRVDGDSVGKVTGLSTHAAQDLLIVEATDGARCWCPSSRKSFPRWTSTAGSSSSPRRPGLFELTGTTRSEQD